VRFAGQNIVAIADACLVTINSVAKRPRGLNYKRQFIGLTDGRRPNNFVNFEPLKSRMRVSVRLSPIEPWVARLQESPIDFKPWNSEL
jgi:hypothetical protein